MKSLSSTQKAYIAGFLDGDGSIYVQMKPNSTYKYGFQISSYIVLFQSKKERVNFEKICSLIGLGYIRERRDGILEYIIGREKSIRIFLGLVKPFLILKRKQANLILQILNKKSSVKNIKGFQSLADLIERFRKLNYSKKRKKRVLTP